MSKTAVSELVDATQPQFTYGADYNPEQWSEETWNEDVRLMREAGVNLVAINIFGWAQLEPLPEQFTFDRLDRIIELLHANGIGINLGTATASPPPWLSAEFPETLPMMADGTRRAQGGRQAYCPSSTIFRERSLALVTEVAKRYGSHPAIKLWHVSNELGCHNAHCYCDASAHAFRGWLQDKYGTLDALNSAWGTAFWSQHYADWDHVMTPRLTVATGNPGQAADFLRFSSDEALGQYLAEQSVIQQYSSIPITTNFMVAAHIRQLNYWTWKDHMDVIANDHYLDHRLPDPTAELAFAADTTRALADGGSWLLMEQATSAVNWQPHNIAKGPGEMLRNSLTHVARGADGISFFQWRASLQGSERFHSSMLPHAGTDSQVWRDVVTLGQTLKGLKEVLDSRVVADVALVFSWDSWWVADLDSHPSTEVKYLEQVHATYRALRELGLTVDIVKPGADLDGYGLVIVPCLHSVTDDVAARLSQYVENGGHAVITFFSGISDGDDRVRTGGYPGAFRELLGVSTEEFFPLHADELVQLDNGATATLWTEKVRPQGAEVVASFTTGPLPGVPAVTRNTYGSGTAWYLATALDAASLANTLEHALHDAGVSTDRDSAARGLEVVTRQGAHGTYRFVINHSTQDADFAVSGAELITGSASTGTLDVPAGSVRVVRLAAAPDSLDASSVVDPAAGDAALAPATESDTVRELR